MSSSATRCQVPRRRGGVSKTKCGILFLFWFNVNGEWMNVSM